MTSRSNHYVLFPMRVTPTGNIDKTDYDTYIKGLIEQFLFTIPGERVNRPEFGAGVQRLVFKGANSGMLAALKFSVQAFLQTTLSDYIKIIDVSTSFNESYLYLTIRYFVYESQSDKQVTFHLDTL